MTNETKKLLNKKTKQPMDIDVDDINVKTNKKIHQMIKNGEIDADDTDEITKVMTNELKKELKKKGILEEKIKNGEIDPDDLEAVQQFMTNETKKQLNKK